MGEILLCREPIAALPYYIEGISWNIYSLEELCYYIENNTYLLEKNFMNEDLCAWIEQEVNNAELAKQLRSIIKRNGRLSEFVKTILVECGYCPREIIWEVITTIHEMEEKSDFERSKIRADRLMEKEKFLSSIYEYKSLLASEDAKNQSRVLIGSIWHNLGTAYARLFLFQEAVHCYEKAYRLNENPESLRECLMAQHCLHSETGLMVTAEKYQVPEHVVQEIQKELEIAGKSRESEVFHQKLEKIAKMNVKGQRAAYHKAISNVIFGWKEEYRRICRI